jgi:hypothetical protein
VQPDHPVASLDFTVNGLSVFVAGELAGSKLEDSGQELIGRIQILVDEI